MLMLSEFLAKIPLEIQAGLVILSAQLCFSGWHICASIVLKSGADPLVFVLYRVIGGTSLMLLYAKWKGLSMVIDPVDYQRVFLAGLLSLGNMVLGIIALSVISPSRFAIFQPSVPCIATGLAMALKMEHISMMKVAGISVAVLGALLAEVLKSNSTDATETNIPLGVTCTILQVFCVGGLTVVNKPLLTKYPPVVITGAYFSVTALLALLVCLIRIDTFPPSAFNFSGHTFPWIGVAYVSIFTTFYAFVALSWGGRFLPPSTTTAYFTFQPLGTIILSALILGSVVTLPEVVGGLLIVLGLIITALSQKMHMAKLAGVGAAGAYGGGGGGRRDHRLRLDSEEGEEEDEEGSYEGEEQRQSDSGSSVGVEMVSVEQQHRQAQAQAQGTAYSGLDSCPVVYNPVFDQHHHHNRMPQQQQQRYAPLPLRQSQGQSQEQSQGQGRFVGSIGDSNGAGDSGVQPTAAYGYGVGIADQQLQLSSGTGKSSGVLSSSSSSSKNNFGVDGSETSAMGVEVGEGVGGAGIGAGAGGLRFRSRSRSSSNAAAAIYINQQVQSMYLQQQQQQQQPLISSDSQAPPPPPPPSPSPSPSPSSVSSRTATYNPIALVNPAFLRDARDARDARDSSALDDRSTHSPPSASAPASASATSASASASAPGEALRLPLPAVYSPLRSED
jgi:drug/metabolite transporter (DMT)-like permease